MLHASLPLQNQRTCWGQRDIQDGKHRLHILPRNLISARLDALHDLATYVGQGRKLDLRKLRSFAMETHQGCQIHIFDPFEVQLQPTQTGIQAIHVQIEHFAPFGEQ
jgi:hypothetical protein